MKSKLVQAVALALTIANASACTPRMMGDIATAAFITAAIVGTAHVMADHDAHYHYDHCGHSRRWHHGHWVYYYGGAWEYYEPRESSWYYYEE